MATRSPREETRERAVPEKKTRVPLGVPRAKLSVPKRPGYVRRWINDDDKGRLHAAKEGGYTHVCDPDLRVGEDGGGSQAPDSRVSRIVGRGEGGKPLRAFLMEIPSELYKEDQASKQSALDEVDRAIRKGRLVPQGEEHRYVPDQGKAIRVDRQLARSEQRDDAEDE